jgi:type III pantothenate kinase
MNLILDLGNTLCKVALFKGDELIETSFFEKLDLQILQNYVEKKPGIKAAITSSVINQSDEINNFLKSNFDFIDLSKETRIPIKNLYKTPDSLGKDRIANAVGANFLSRDKNVLVIDAGTCIKYDFVSKENEYLGGGISPGIEIRFKSLNTFTDKLPLVSFQPFEKLIGETTTESILSGVINGCISEVKEMIKKYQEQFPDVETVLTGGYSKFFEKLLKNTIFADPFLTLKGLNVILNYNAERKS